MTYPIAGFAVVYCSVTEIKSKIPSGGTLPVVPPLNENLVKPASNSSLFVIGAVQIAKESIDYGPVMDLRIEWVDPNIGTPEQNQIFLEVFRRVTAGK